MKRTKFKKYIISLAALLIVVAAMTACSSENTITDEPINEPIVKPEAPKTYTMTVQASKGDNATTRALSLSGSTLNATWAQGEEVTVYNVTKNTDLTGTLTAQSSGASTTLKGTLGGTIENGDKLTLKFLSPTYGTQDGTLTGSATSIDKVCDYAEATVTVASVTSGNITINEPSASFANQQAIVKFTLKKKADDSNLVIPAATALTVNDGTNNYTVTPTSDSNVLFVAIPATSTVNLSTTVGSYTYTYEKTGVTLTNGKYYAIVVKMARNVNLSSVNANFELQDGDIVTGTLANNVKISIANDATVTLNGVNINTSTNAGITCAGNANIILVGTNTVITTGSGWAAIQAGGDLLNLKTLTISGSGNLTAQGGPGGAGIGGNRPRAFRDITISGGTVTAIGGNGAAGIGSGEDGSCGNITISGGTVTATGGSDAAGIGSGLNGNCGDITITTGVTKVTATKGAVMAVHSIGKGYNGPCGKVTIGGTVYKDGTTYPQGEDYLTQSPLIYQP